MTQILSFHCIKCDLNVLNIKIRLIKRPFHPDPSNLVELAYRHNLCTPLLHILPHTDTSSLVRNPSRKWVFLINYFCATHWCFSFVKCSMKSQRNIKKKMNNALVRCKENGGKKPYIWEMTDTTRPPDKILVFLLMKEIWNLQRVLFLMRFLGIV